MPITRDVRVSYCNILAGIIQQSPIWIPSRTMYTLISFKIYSCQCIVCDRVFPEAKRKSDDRVEVGRGQICSGCLDQPQRVALQLNKKLKTWDRTYDQVYQN